MSIRTFFPVILCVFLAAGCGGDAGEGAGGGESEMEAAGEQQAMSAETEETAQPQPETIGDLFPEGDGRIMVLNNCASCHAVACSAIGQRTPSRWNGIQSAHMDRLPGVSEEEIETIFSYLESNFNDTIPEPNVPRAFLARGCTPN